MNVIIITGLNNSISGLTAGVDQDNSWLVGCLMARQHRKVNLSQLRGRETDSVGHCNRTFENI